MLSVDAVLVPTWVTAPFRDRGIIWIQERFSKMLFYNTLTSIAKNRVNSIHRSALITTYEREYIFWRLVLNEHQG